MNGCDICKEDRPDILRTDPFEDPCLEPVKDCSCNCPDNEPGCECPGGHFSGTCVHYSGCKTFITRINPGMSYDEIVLNIERTFGEVDKILDLYKEDLDSLTSRLEELETIVKEGK